MPIYEYRCPDGHVTEIVRSMHDDIPADVPCEQAMPCSRCGIAQGCCEDCCAPGCADRDELVERCAKAARRVFGWAATHYKGAGTYTTDYKLKYDRKRRRNPGDDLPIPTEAAITRREGAEYDPPKRMPGVVHRQDVQRV